ncbi:MAG TPA: YihY/virulence factor BrkB family protein [Armatimonadota bacterium]|jgi:membrane protein
MQGHVGAAGTPVPRKEETIAGEGRGAVAYLKALGKRFMVDKCPVMAAAMSFFSLLSIVPMLLVAIGALAIFTGSTYEATRQIENLGVRMLPGKAAQDAFLQLTQQLDLHGFVHNLKHAGPRNLAIGVITLLWAALQIFVNASGSLNAAFEVEEKRSWFRLRLVAAWVMCGAVLFFLLSFASTAGPDVVRRILPRLGIPNPAPWPVNALFFFVALGLNVAMFAFIYRYLPNGRVSWRDALAGGGVMGVLWIAATKGMTLFLATPNRMFGALGGTVLIITWMYYSNMLLLLGAEVAALLAKSHRAGTESTM